ncbi:MAG TPA: PfkB family carbohydrate kinase [Bdellovibrionales bacterium]|nr:PfkB family carbohydrate kinase [Bdellovibrionales bacterium]
MPAKTRQLDIRKELMQQLLPKVDALKGRRMIIVGDSGLDEYVFGKVRRISPEAPVPVVEVTDNGGASDYRLGLSTNVAQNITALGGECLLVSVVGDDAAAKKLAQLLERERISPEHLVVDHSRPTTRKLRVMSGQHHLVRVDFEHQRFLSDELHDKICKTVSSLLPKADGVIIQDYAKGVVSESCVQQIVKLTKAAGKKVLADPHRSTPLSYYKGTDLMTPNYDEAVALSGLRVDDLRQVSDSLQEVGDALRAGTGSRQMVITRGKEGMSLFEGEQSTRIPTFAKQVFDVAGAGDTVIAALSMAWVGGLSLEDSCLIANHAAGVVVGKVGCVPCTRDELIQAIKEHA